jgi:hypothetical protein
MTRARPKFNLPPRGLIEYETAGYIGLGPTDFSRVLPQLEAEGFPKPDPVTGRRDLKAIDAWLDARSGLTGESYDGGLGQRLKALKDGTHPN